MSKNQKVQSGVKNVKGGKVTVAIRVNIAAADMWEGEEEIYVTVPAEVLESMKKGTRSIENSKFENTFWHCLSTAAWQFEAKNGQ